MTHVLVTFLGAPDRSRPPTRRPRPHYQEITYDFKGCTPSSAPDHDRIAARIARRGSDAMSASTSIRSPSV